MFNFPGYPISLNGPGGKVEWYQAQGSSKVWCCGDVSSLTLVRLCAGVKVGGSLNQYWQGVGKLHENWALLSNFRVLFCNFKTCQMLLEVACYSNFTNFRISSNSLMWKVGKVFTNTWRLLYAYCPYMNSLTVAHKEVRKHWFAHCCWREFQVVGKRTHIHSTEKKYLILFWEKRWLSTDCQQVGD